MKIDTHRGKTPHALATVAVGDNAPARRRSPLQAIGQTAGRRLAAILLALPLAIQAGCATAGDNTAAAALDAIEQRLLQAPVLRIDYVIEASGGIEVMLHGDLVAQKPALVAVASHGSFAGSDAKLVLVSDGRQLQGGNDTERFAGSVPAALHEGILIGLVRMGVLHNLAMLSAAAPPDATDGSVRDWVQPRRIRWFDTADATRGIRFEIDVGGEPAGEVRLWLDGTSGLPVRREQLVHFDNGDMRVREFYDIETDGIIGPCRFDPKTVALTD